LEQAQARAVLGRLEIPFSFMQVDVKEIAQRHGVHGFLDGLVELGLEPLVHGPRRLPRDPRGRTVP